MSHWNLDKFNFKNFIYNEDQITDKELTICKILENN